MNNDQLLILVMGCILIVGFVVIIIGLLIADWRDERAQAKRSCADSEYTSLMVGCLMPNIKEGDLLTIGDRELKVLSVSYDGTTLTVTTGDVDAEDN